MGGGDGGEQQNGSNGRRWRAGKVQRKVKKKDRRDDRAEATARIGDCRRSCGSLRSAPGDVRLTVHRDSWRDRSRLRQRRRRWQLFQRAHSSKRGKAGPFAAERTWARSTSARGGKGGSTAIELEETVTRAVGCVRELRVVERLELGNPQERSIKGDAKGALRLCRRRGWGRWDERESAGGRPKGERREAEGPACRGSEEKRARCRNERQ